MTKNKSLTRLLFSLAVMLVFANILMLIISYGLPFFASAEETAPPPPQIVDAPFDEKVGSTQFEPVVFSLDCGFYAESKTLTLGATEAVQILYTTDGSDPSVSGTPYTGLITLTLPEDAGIANYTITACALYQDGSYSEPVTRTYFVGSEIAERFDCLVFSITVDPEDLYGYENGIFVEGKLRDEWLAANPNVDPEDADPSDPANWNMSGREAEREAYVEVYEYDGNCVIAQDCGLRIFGGWSRAHPQKNLRLFARTEYDAKDNRFRYAFFPDALDSNGKIIDSYKRISLRASGNDNSQLYMREDMISYLTHATELEAKYSRPAAIFLNGEYYGFAWCQQVLGDDLLDHTYNLEESQWDILEGTERELAEDAGNEYWQEAADDWNYVMSLVEQGLTNDSVYEEFCQLVDVDNFLTYYAMYTYLGNTDWPYNNWKIFRYSDRNAPVDASMLTEEAQEITDGRWRFLTYDTDYCIGLNYASPTETHFTNAYYYSDVLYGLCEREEVRERFLSIMTDLMYWYFSPDLVSDTMDMYSEMRLHELIVAWESELASIYNVKSGLVHAKSWISQRAENIFTQLTNAFPDYTERYRVNAASVEGAIININTVSIAPGDDTYHGEYYAGIEIPISFQLEDGYEFDHWEIDSYEVYDESFVLDASLYGSVVDLELFVKRTESQVKIYEVCYKGSDGDYFTLKNFGDKDISITGMKIWDGEQGVAFSLPEGKIAAGETLTVICKNYSRNDKPNATRCDFNLSEGETLTLYAKDGSVSYEVVLPDGTDGAAIRLDNFTGEYSEFIVQEKNRIIEVDMDAD